MSPMVLTLNKNKLLLEKLFLLTILAGQLVVLILLFSDDLLHFDECSTWFCNVDAMVDGCKYLFNDLGIVACLFSFHLVSMFVCLLSIIEHDLDYFKFISQQIFFKLLKDFIHLCSIIDASKLLCLIKIKDRFKIPTTYFLVLRAETSSSFLPFV